jgi:hypothetical protein
LGFSNWPVILLHQQTPTSFLVPSSPSHHCLEILFFTCFLSFDLCEVSAFCFLHSDNENPKKDVATAPSIEATAADEPSLQEAALVVKSPKALVKRVASTRGSKHLKKSTDAGASLDTHRSTSSSDDVRIDPSIFALFLA